MKKSTGILIIIGLIIIGIAAGFLLYWEYEDNAYQEEDEIIEENIILPEKTEEQKEEQNIEEIKEPEIKEEEPETKPEEPKKEEPKKEIPPEFQVIQPPVKQEAKPLKVYNGKIATLNPAKMGVYSGEVTDIETLRHYLFKTEMIITKGDTVTFTVQQDQATILSKEVRHPTKQTSTRDTTQPEGTELAHVITVMSTPEGTLRGKLRNARDGEEYIYTTALSLFVNDRVYYIPGSQPVTVIKKAG